LHDLQVLVQDRQGLAHGFHNGFGEIKTALGGVDIDQHQHGAVGFAIRPHGGEDAKRIASSRSTSSCSRSSHFGARGDMLSGPAVPSES
jgi:hypothetical protein